MTNLFHDGGRSIRHIIEAVWWCGPASLAARPIWNDVGRRFEADEMGKDRKMVVVVEALGDSSISFLLDPLKKRPRLDQGGAAHVILFTRTQRARAHTHTHTAAPAAFFK